MAIHLFSTPVQCTQCGTVVEDPSVDRCPNCGSLLKERRAPSRLAGVEHRYGSIRFLMGFLRFLGVITFLMGLLLFAFGDESVTWAVRLLTLFGGVLVAAGLFVVAGMFQLQMDIEENTRATFRIQQKVLAELQGQHERGSPPTV